MNDQRMLSETRTVKSIVQDLADQHPGLSLMAHAIVRSFEEGDLLTLTNRLIGKIEVTDELFEKHAPDYVAASKVARDLVRCGYTDESNELTDEFLDHGMTAMVAKIYDLGLNLNDLFEVKEILAKHVPAKHLIAGLSGKELSRDELAELERIAHATAPVLAAA